MLRQNDIQPVWMLVRRAYIILILTIMCPMEGAIKSSNVAVKSSNMAAKSSNMAIKLSNMAVKSLKFDR